jgi:hypothetical protein
MIAFRWVSLVAISALSACANDTSTVPSGEAAMEASPPELSIRIDEASSPELALTTVEFGSLGTVSMVRPILQSFSEGRDGAGPDIRLMYSVRYSDDTFLDLDMPYESGDVRFNMAEARASVSLSKGNQRLRGVDGEGAIGLSAQGVRVEFTAITWAAAPGDLDPQDFPEVVVEGEVQHLCMVLAIDPAAPTLDGVAAPQYRRDVDWTTPFCSQLKQAFHL